MIKKFKLLKQIESSNSIKVGETFEIYDDYVRLDELGKLHYTWFVTHGYIKEVKDNHFGNGMIDGGELYWINTRYDLSHVERYKSMGEGQSISKDRCIFQTKEQAQQFDKMMMTVWKIWKWKKVNDDVSGQEYCLYYDKDRKEFDRDDHDTDYVYSFILPKFSSRETVNQLIYDLGEELNNLLCWIK